NFGEQAWHDSCRHVPKSADALRLHHGDANVSSEVRPESDCGPDAEGQRHPPGNFEHRHDDSGQEEVRSCRGVSKAGTKRTLSVIARASRLSKKRRDRYPARRSPDLATYRMTEGFRRSPTLGALRVPVIEMGSTAPE